MTGAAMWYAYAYAHPEVSLVRFDESMEVL